MNNLRENLIELLEAEASRKQIDYVLKLVGKDDKSISLLVDLALFGEYPHSNRAGWTLDILDRKHPELINPYLEKVLKNLKNVQSDSVKRPVLSILSKRKLPKKYQGFVIDYSFDILQNNKEKIASKVLAMEILANIAEDEPDLLGELFSVIDLQYKDASAGFQSRARNLRKRLM
ncbi:MAG: hypothetical protein FWE63_02285 [Bacteroidales bacterium]|nr:hypothetical protein [Bacteroidales bacterium]